MTLQDTGPPDLGCGVGNGCSMVAPVLEERVDASRVVWG